MTPELDLQPWSSAPANPFRAVFARPKPVAAARAFSARPPVSTLEPSWLVMTGAVAPASQWWHRPPTPENDLATPAADFRSAAAGATLSSRAWGVLLHLLGYR